MRKPVTAIIAREVQTLENPPCNLAGRKDCEGRLTMKATVIDPFRHKLGEGPVWDTAEQALFGCDLLARGVHSQGQSEAKLYSFGPDLKLTTLDTGFTLANGPCWSPDGSQFYVAETTRRQIYVYDYAADGSLANRRDFANTLPFRGVPDGATIDSEGCLWSALCGAGKIVRYRPDGSVALMVDMPTPLVSSVMFGGAGLDRLFVTSIDGLGVKGLPEHRFGA